MAAHFLDNPHNVVGRTLWFEYHCWESHNSNDAIAWYYSQQQVEVISIKTDCDGFVLYDGGDTEAKTFDSRADCGIPIMYRVRWQDGLEWTVFEDELCQSKDDFYCEPPPKNPQLKLAQAIQS